LEAARPAKPVVRVAPNACGKLTICLKFERIGVKQ
jgi:hypothetical protein